jgi:hypothetical protein
MPREIWAVASVLMLCAGSGPSPALGQNETAKLLPADGALEDYFGHAVAVSGSIAVIGMQYDDDQGENSGAAYVFHFDGNAWVQQAKLLPADGETSDKFGVSVAIDGDTIIIGAEEDDDSAVNAGSAYVFRFDGSSWVQQAKLLASDGDTDALFGHSVAISGETALIGTSGHERLNRYTGSAYVFRRDGSSWVQQAKLVASDGAEADLFGVTVDLDGDTAVIGAPYDDVVDRDSGSAYVFYFNGTNWVQQQKIVPADGAKLDSFGAAVAVSGNHLLAGACKDDDNGDDSGSAYVFGFDGTSWVQQAKLLAPGGAANDFFGFSAAIDGNAAIIGVPNDDDGGTNSGAAHIFRFNGENWIHDQKIVASDGAAWDQFGCAVGLSGNTALVGALRDDDQDINSGSAYVFHVTRCPGDLDGDLDVDIADLAQLLGHYDTPEGATYSDGDLDGDGDVDLADLAELLQHYGDDCE